LYLFCLDVIFQKTYWYACINLCCCLSLSLILFPSFTCQIIFFLARFYICFFVHSFDFQIYLLQRMYVHISEWICLSSWSISFLIIPTKFSNLDLDIVYPFGFGFSVFILLACYFLVRLLICMSQLIFCFSPILICMFQFHDLCKLIDFYFAMQINLMFGIIFLKR
jgi:hypothetical protein